MGIGVELDCLEGIRVVDFTQFEAGPSCTEALAWLGAEVVKIENPRTGDPGRRLQPGHPDDPWYFHQFNANKKSVTLNLKSPRGLDIVRELLKKADVTVENMAPGTIERLGLGYDEVRKVNPGIIYCQVKGFGTGSPYEHSLAFDMIAQADGGTISVTGDADRAPVKPGPSFGDTGTGMLMAISILGALYGRSKTGHGRRLQVAMQDAMLHYMRVPFSQTQLSGKAAMRDGSSRSTPGGLTPRALYPCKPGGPNDYVYVFCSRANPEHWQRLLKVIGREDLSGDARYDTQVARSQRGAEVDEIIAGWTRQHTKEEAMTLYGAAGVPAGAVFDTHDDRPYVRRARHHADDRPPHDRQGQDAGLASAFRRCSADGQAVAAARPACRRRARLVVGHGRQGARRPAPGRYRLSRGRIPSRHHQRSRR